MSAHRLAYKLAYGEIPTNKVICHHCDNPSCINPEHLWAGTQSENIVDAYKKGRKRAKKKTHCKWGHPLFGDNLGVYKNGRYCRQCNIKNSAAYRERNKNGMF